MLFLLPAPESLTGMTLPPAGHSPLKGRSELRKVKKKKSLLNVFTPLPVLLGTKHPFMKQKHFCDFLFLLSYN